MREIFIDGYDFENQGFRIVCKNGELGSYVIMDVEVDVEVVRSECLDLILIWWQEFYFSVLKWCWQELEEGVI